ncbi:RhuM family protein [Limnohabitans sp.]|uniref:RhuM family protein n=1 Tax=Limnohabitans sp. TaxID=1907725 RepID=UPI0037BF1CEE
MVYHRANASKDQMGLTSWKDAPLGKIQKFDVVVAKNDLSESEMAQLCAWSTPIWMWPKTWLNAKYP